MTTTKAAIMLMLCSPALGGCMAAAAVAGADALVLNVAGKDSVDLAVSAITGRDCSVVRLDRRQSYCAGPQPVAPSVTCTRTLGTVMCWADPDDLPDRPHSITDTPIPRRAK